MSIRSRLAIASALCLAVLNLSHPAQAGGPIASGTIVSGSVAGPSYLESWTFPGATGDRVIIRAITTSGALNTQTVVRAPGGAVVMNTTTDSFDLQLASNGTFTIEVSDAGLNDAGNYSLSLINVTAGPLTNVGDLDGGPMTSGTVRTGTMSGVADIDAYTFSGNNLDRVVMAAVATAGMNTTILIYPPNGAPLYTYTFGDKLDIQLNATGTWAIVIEDNGNDTAGTYDFSFLNVTSGPHTTGSDTDGAVIVSNESTTGQYQQGVDFDAFTFSGTAGDRVIVIGLATGAGSHNTQMAVYPPGGGSALTLTSSDNFDVALTQTGTHTIVIEDAGNDDTGTYTLAMLNVTSGPYTNVGDLDGGPMTSGTVRTGTMSGVADIDAFTFSGNSGDRVVMAAVATAGMNTTILVYPPNGAPLYTYTFGDKLDIQLNATGTWAIVIEDNGNDTAGTYDLSLLNVTSGPHTSGGDTDGAVIVSNESTTGQYQQGVDFDAFTFSGTAGDRVIVIGLATGGGSHNTQMAVYPPGGGSALTLTSSDNFDVALTQTGTHTIVIEDASNDDTGTYTLAMLNVTSGPHTNGGDLDGGPMTSGTVRTGTMSGLADIDAFTFSGNNLDRVVMAAVATAGMNTTILIYPPNGAPLYTYTFGDKLDIQLNATGTWAIVIEDNGNDTAGTYDLSLLNVTSGPHTHAGDTDGGFIGSNQIKTGQYQQGVDFDAFTFTGQANHRYIVLGLATGGGLHNTQMAVYPPGGGSALTLTSSDQFDVKATSAGTYTIVIEDAANDHTGAYSLSLMNVTGGAFTSGGDTGGPIASNGIVSGSMGGLGDIDAWQFYASEGSRVLLSAVATGGVGFNTTILLYPPDGGPLYTYTFGDRLDVQVNNSGNWVAVIEDNNYDTAGDYTLSLLNVTAGPYTGGPESDGGPIADNVPVNASAYSVGDFDGYTFFGIGGQTVNINCVATSGAMNTQTTVYPPFGGSPVTSTSIDVFNALLSVNGVYTVVVEDVGLDQTGNYTLTVDLTGTPTGVGDGPSFRTVALLPAAPSPFSYSTRMGFELPDESRVQLRVYDVTGARVRSLVDDRRGAGAHWVEWDGRDDRGMRVASGVYYATLEAAGVMKHQKLVLIR